VRWIFFVELTRQPRTIMLSVGIKCSTMTYFVASNYCSWGAKLRRASRHKWRRLYM